MSEYKWSHLNHLQIGKYAEYLVKMELIQQGFDVYTSEVDDRGIDFVVRINSEKYYDIQVKSVRGLKYIFFPKDKFVLKSNLIAAIVIFFERKPPQFYLIPSEQWKSTDSLLVEHNYEDKKSKPEYGINLSDKNLALLSKYNFEKIIKNL